MWVSIVSPTMPYPALCLFLEAAIPAEAECSFPMSEPPAKKTVSSTVLTLSHLLCLKEKYSQNSFVCISPVDHRSAVPVTHFQQTGAKVRGWLTSQSRSSLGKDSDHMVGIRPHAWTGTCLSLSIPYFSFKASKLCIYSEGSKALLPPIASALRFWVRFGDVATVLLLVIPAGGSDIRKQSPTSTTMIASRKRHSAEHGKSVLGKHSASGRPRAILVPCPLPGIFWAQLAESSSFWWEWNLFHVVRA